MKCKWSIMEFKWSHHVIQERMPQINMVWHKVRTPVAEMGYILLNHWTNGYHGASKYQRLMLMPLVALHIQKVRPHRWRPNLHMSSNMKYSWCPTKSFNPTDYCSWCWKKICKLLGEKSNHQNHPATNPETYNSDRPARYISATVTQMPWE